MDRAQKAELVAELKQTFSETNVVVVTRNLGLSVAQSTQLRNKMREAGARYKVIKNRLALRALEGTPYAPISEMLTGPTAIATSSDPVAAAKIAVEFAKAEAFSYIRACALPVMPARLRLQAAGASLPPGSAFATN